MSVADFAEYLGVSVRTAWRLISLGEVKSIRIGRCVRVLRDSADALIERGGTGL